MKKMLVRAAILAIFTAGVTTTVGIVGAGTAMACGEEPQRSDQLAASLPQVNYGDSGKHVLALQLRLKAFGYRLTGTGKYAGNTLAAVKDFQRKHGINDSGIVGSKTWHVLVGSMGPSLTGQGWVKVPAIGITPGERNEAKVEELHTALWRIYYDREVPVEGDTYGPATQALVKDFQRRAGVKASGIVGPKTWAAMYEVIAVTGMWGC